MSTGGGIQDQISFLHPKRSTHVWVPFLNAFVFQYHDSAVFLTKKFILQTIQIDLMSS